MNCDRIARWYQFLEYLAFGRALQRRRVEYLELVGDARSILILGDGDGRFTAEYVTRNPAALVESVDLSKRMLELAAARVAHYKVRFRLGDARTIELEGKYDLVVTHFFLDCFTEEELGDLMARVSNCCVPDARWLVSEFRLPDNGFRRLAARALIRVMYFFFWAITGLEVTRLPDYSPLLTLNGFRIASRHVATGGLLVSELWSYSERNATTGSTREAR